ncbi:MAG: hypothetical protein ACKE5M_04810 [Methylophilaceae bacterium]
MSSNFTFAEVSSTFTYTQLQQALQQSGMAVDGIPEVRKPIEKWNAARNKSKEDEWSRWLKNKKTHLDLWISESKKREDHFKPVGWAHDYVDSKTGKWLYWSPKKSIPVGASDKLVAAWRMRVRVHNLEQMLNATRLYKLHGNIRYRNWVISQMGLYAKAYTKLPLQTWNGQSQLFNQALDEAVYSFHLLEIVRLLKEDVLESELNEWKLKLFMPMVKNLMVSSSGFNNNISVWIAASIAAIGKEFDELSLITFGINSDKGLSALLDNAVSKDFFWNENSLSYQDYVVSALYNWLYASLARGDNSELVQHIGLITKNLMLSPVVVRFKNSVAPRLGDSHGERTVPNNKLLTEVWRVLPTAQGIAYANSQKSWGSLIDTPPSNVARSSIPPLVSRQIKGLDAVQLVSANWHALIRYGEKVTGHHAHQESMTYDLQHNSNWLFRDQGTLGYGTALHKNYFKRVQAHTGALINREGQLPWPSMGEMQSLDLKKNKLTVSHANFQLGNDVIRTLQIKQNKFMERTNFQISNKKKVPVGVTYQTACKVNILNGLQLTKNDTLDKKGAFSYWEKRKEYLILTNKDITLNLQCEKYSYSMKVAGVDLNKLYIAQTPSPKKDEILTGIYFESSPVSSSSITTLIYMN